MRRTRSPQKRLIENIPPSFPSGRIILPLAGTPVVIRSAWRGTVINKKLEYRRRRHKYALRYGTERRSLSTLNFSRPVVLNFRD